MPRYAIYRETDGWIRQVTWCSPDQAVAAASLDEGYAVLPLTETAEGPALMTIPADVQVILKSGRVLNTPPTLMYVHEDGAAHPEPPPQAADPLGPPAWVDVPDHPIPPPTPGGPPTSPPGKPPGG